MYTYNVEYTNLFSQSGVATLSAEKIATNEQTTKPQRDAQGRFVQGNDGGPGNPFGRHLGRARCKWNSLATPEHVENVYNAVYEKAIDGCVAAMKLYLLYLLGKPNPMPNPDHVDLEEYQLYEKATRMLKRSADVMTSPDHSFALEVARTARPAIAEETRKKMLEGFEEAEEREREIDAEIKQMEEEYDRQQAKKRSAAAKRAAKRGAKKQRRASVKRAKAGVARKPSELAERQGLSLPDRRDEPGGTHSPAPLDNGFSPYPSPLVNGFFPPPAPSSNGFHPHSDLEASDG